jgi:WD40 repeat protein
VLIPLAHRSPVHALGADGQGRIISYGGDDLLRSWDATTGAPGAFTAPLSAPTTMLVGPAGPMVVAVDALGVHRWPDAPLIRPPGTEWSPVTSGIRAAALLADGDGVLVAAGGLGGRVHRWDVLTGEPLGPPWSGHVGRELALTMLRLPDGRAVVVSAGEENPLQRWDAVTGEPVGAPLTGLEVPAEWLAAAAGTVVAQTSAGSLHRWDVTTGEQLGPPLRHGSGPGGLALTPDARMVLAVDGDGTPWLWDLTLDDPSPRALDTTGIDAVTVAPSPDGWLFVTGDARGRLRRWDAAGREVGSALSGHPAAVQRLVGGERGLLISYARDGARCWDTTTGSPVGTAAEPLPTGDRMAAAWLPDGRLILGSGVEEGILRCDALDGTVYEPDEERVVWDVAAGRMPDGRPFFAGAAATGAVHLVDAESGAALGQPLRGLRGQALTVAVTTLPDGTVLVAAGGESRKVLRWNAVTGEQLGEPLTGLRGSVLQLSFDGVLLTATDDRGVTLCWNARTGEPVDPRQGAVPADQAVVTLPDGRRLLAAGHADGSITIDPLRNDPSE